MAGPNVEVFKFGLYMFFPVWIMFKFGDPQWYQDYVLPYKNTLWPAYETTHRPPKTVQGVDAELARYKAERAAKRARQQSQTQTQNAQHPDSSDTTADSSLSTTMADSSGIAATASAFYARRAAGANTTVASAGNDGERMV